jgi:tetratricopeptide (TPR) repeat protein
VGAGAEKELWLRCVDLVSVVVKRPLGFVTESLFRSLHSQWLAGNLVVDGVVVDRPRQVSAGVLHRSMDPAVAGSAVKARACDPLLWGKDRTTTPHTPALDHNERCPICAHNQECLEDIKGTAPNLADCDLLKVGEVGGHWELAKAFGSKLGHSGKSMASKEELPVDMFYNALNYCPVLAETDTATITGSAFRTAMKEMADVRNAILHARGDSSQPARVMDQAGVDLVADAVRAVLRELRVALDRAEARFGSVADMGGCLACIAEAESFVDPVKDGMAEELRRSSGFVAAFKAEIPRIIEALEARATADASQLREAFQSHSARLVGAVAKVVEKDGDKTRAEFAVLRKEWTDLNRVQIEVEEKRRKEELDAKYPDLSNAPVVGVLKYAVERTAVQARIRGWVEDGVGSQRPVLMVEGPPGIGKSSAVTKAALDLRGRFSFVRYMDGRSLSSLHESVLDMAVQAKIASRTDKVDDILVNQVLVYLGDHARETGMPYLIVVEDASGLVAPDRPDLAGEAEEARELVLKLAWGRSGGEVPGVRPAGRVLGTVWSSSVFPAGKLESVPVDLFSEAESLEVLGMLHAAGKGSEGHASIARALGYYPLAVSQAGHLLSTRKEADAADRFAKQILKKVEESQEAKKTEGGHAYFGATCFLALEVAEKLAGDLWDDVVKPLLAVLGALDGPGGIADGMIERWLMREGGPAEGDDFEAGELFRVALDEVLVPAGLVVRDTGRMTMHRLFQDVVWRRFGGMGGVEGAAVAVGEENASLVSYHGHCQRLWDVAEGVVGVLPASVLDVAVGWLGSVVADHFCLFEKARNGGEMLMGRCDGDLVRASVMGLIGSALKSLARYDEALQQYQESLAVRRRVLPADHADIATSLNSIAIVLDSKGDLDGALSMHQESLAMKMRVLPADHADIATSLSKIANVLYVKGNLDGALSMYQESLAMRRRVLPTDHADIASSLNNIANVLRTRGDLDGALAMYQESLAMRRRILPADHADIARSLNNIAIVLGSKDDLDGALSTYQASLAMWRRVLPADHVDIARSLNNIATVLKSKGDLDGALSMHQASLAMWRRRLPADHAYIASSLNNIANVLSDKGDLDGALSMYQESLAIRRRVLPADHADIATSLHNIAVLLAAKGDLDGALSMHQESEVMLGRVLP